jgi:hypothetical protein
MLYLHEFSLHKRGLRSSCKYVVIIPGVVELNQTFVVKMMVKSFLKKHSVLILFSRFAMLYEYGVNKLRNVTEVVLNTDLVFERRNTFNGRLVKLLYMDDPPRSRAIDGRVMGLDGLFLDGYVKYMNTDYVVVKHFEKRNYTYEMRYLNSNINLFMFNVIDYVYPFNQMAIMFYMFGFTHQCLLVPKQPNKTMIDQFLQILQPNLIILLLMVFIVFGLIFFLVLRLRPKLRLGIFDVYFILFQITITNSVDRKLRTLFEKMSLLAYIVLCFLVVSGVQSFMKQFLMSPSATEIDTLDQLNRSNLRIIVNNINYQLLKQSYDDAFMEKVDRVEYLITESINRSYAYIWNSEDVDRFYNSKANFVNGVPQMHRMKECSAKYYRGYVGPLDGFYEQSMHFYLQAIEESGIRLFWEQQRHVKGDVRHHSDEEALVTLGHLKRVFNMLFVGWGAASMAFLAEVVVGRIKKFMSK